MSGAEYDTIRAATSGIIKDDKDAVGAYSRIVTNLNEAVGATRNLDLPGLDVYRPATDTVSVDVGREEAEEILENGGRLDWGSGWLNEYNGATDDGHILASIFFNKAEPTETLEPERTIAVKVDVRSNLAPIEKRMYEKALEDAGLETERKYSSGRNDGSASRPPRE